MNEDFYQKQAQTIRDLADKADPFIKKRLLELAKRYDRFAPKRPTPLPVVPIKDDADHEHRGSDPG